MRREQRKGRKEEAPKAIERDATLREQESEILRRVETTVCRCNVRYLYYMCPSPSLGFRLLLSKALAERGAGRMVVCVCV